MENETKLKLVVTRREYVFREIQILYDLSRSVSVDKSKLGEFKCRYKRIDQLRQEYLDYTNEINMLKLILNSEESINMKSMDAFDSLYYAVKEAADAVLSSPPSELGFVTGTTSVGASAIPTNNIISQIRLPKIELVKFNGNIECWQTFYDTFVSLVHHNQQISNIEKFHYLLSCLLGPALSIAKGVPVTSDNYNVVFEALISRYQNKRILAVNYLEKICNYSVLKSCNFNDLRKLTSILQESVNALKSVDIENLGEFILFYLASRKLDSDTRKRFELNNNNEIPTFSDLLSFLQEYLKVLEASEPSVRFTVDNTSTAMGKVNNYYPRSSTYAANNVQFKKSKPYSGVHSNTGLDSDGDQMPKNDSYYNAAVYSRMPSNNFSDCTCCGYNNHTIYRCPVFQAKNLNEREAIVKNKQLCRNCLRTSHLMENCFSKTSCSKCNERHHTFLHRDQTVSTSRPVLCETTNEILSASADPRISITSSNTTAHMEHGRSLVLLGTCVVRARGPHGIINIRALIDSGAQDCFVTSSCARRLGLPLRRCNVIVAGLGQSTVHEIQGVTSFAIQPSHSCNPVLNIQAIVMKTITHQMPSVNIPDTVKAHYKHLMLADDNFDKISDIDLLIGAELFHNIYDGQRLDVGPGLPVALHSVFGWVITGKLDYECRPPVQTASLVVSTLALEDVVKRFWEIEEPPRIKILNPEDEKCEKMYTDLVQRKPDGRYVVPMLVKENHEDLGDSFQSSLSRFYNLERRLLRQENLKNDYTNFMKEYEDLHHMQLVRPIANEFRYIIPHHCVLRPDSCTTKLRVVFDASAKTTNGLALNDIVYVGPKLQNDILDIITKFRLHEVVFTADISKMYRNIELRPEDRKYQHILWRNSNNQKVQEFQLKTVTYGVSSSPYLAIRTLHQLAADHGNQYPLAASILKQDTFMDDITAGAPSLEVALEIKAQLIQLLAHAKFDLRKWSSNSLEFLACIPSDHCQIPKIFGDDINKQSLKILGVQWDPSADVFTYSQSEFNTKYTKRAILSNVARIYDPLGWLTPIVLKAKLLIQDLWRFRLDWDDPVPKSSARQWTEFTTELQHLRNVSIPRLAIVSNSTRHELIGFCDGSSKAYGCCVYLRSSNNEKTMVHLLIAKSKVAPIKPLTVNRLELLGAAMLAGVLKHVLKLLSSHLNFTRIIAFTDSTTVLAWLNTEPYKLKTFVSHRVTKIVEQVEVANWYHVPTADNPADHSSRGLSCSQLVSSTAWWSGPAWLSYSSSYWPVSKEISSLMENIPEMKELPHLTHCCTSIPGDDVIDNILNKYSSFSRVQRILAWCLRFSSNARRVARTSGCLTSVELKSSWYLLIRHEQMKYLTEEINAVINGKSCSRPIQKLNPFLDQQGLLRVGGRLKNASLPLSAIYPLILSKASPLSILLVEYYHRLYLHCGPRTLQSLIQRQVWILGIRNLIRSRLSKCVTCFKIKPKSLSPLMGDLPVPRVQTTRCFQNIGVDFAGPFLIKESKRRNARTYKVYVCVMVCLAVKAIHLELVTDLSAAAFIAAFDRFVSRRGLCKLVISDCGTNFVGAKRYLNDITQFLLTENSNLNASFTQRDIVWQHNPPTASHFGGIFESGVKSMKYHLKRVVGLQILTYEEMLTVLNKIEAILNSRPLYALSSDPSEVDVLTPGHFLIGGPLVSLPEAPLTDAYLPPRERWQMLQKITQSFWKVWRRDYLHTLQQRCKWFRGQANIQLDQIVTIVDSNLPPLEWRSGRVTELHPGHDDVVRVVTVRTAKGLLRRPVTKLCPLPITD